jgi:hypothetical protein
VPDLEKPPYPLVEEEVMCNYHHTIDQQLSERLVQEEISMRYTAWNFFGVVWFDRGGKCFKCEIHVYNVIQEVICASTLTSIMRQACDKYGEE